MVVGCSLLGCGDDAGDAKEDLVTTTSTIRTTSSTSPSTAVPSSDLGAEPAEDTGDDIAAFVAVADAICSPANERITELDETLFDESASLQELAPTVRQQVMIREQVSVDLGELLPPEALDEPWSLWLESRAQFEKGSNELLEVMDAGDMDGFLETYDTLDPTIADLNRLGEALASFGFEDCGQLEAF